MDKRRKHERLILDEPSILQFHGKACYLIDISEAGMGITFISDEEWPVNMYLSYSLPQGPDRNGSVHCCTAWELKMDFFKLGCWETVHRRGLKFLDPASQDAEILYSHSFARSYDYWR